MNEPLPPRTVQRVRHELRLRKAEVRRIVDITPHLRRITLGGDELQGFTSASYDDHVKLFFPLPGEREPLLPTLPPGGPGTAGHDPQGQKPIARDYTPRRFDPQALELDIEFVLHGDGPASTWAEQAKVGDRLGIGGPRGSFIVPNDFDWYLLVGDESALPAIARRLEELPVQARVKVVVEVADKSDRPPLARTSATEITWLHRDGAEPGRSGLLQRAVSVLSRPEGEGYVWAAGESAEIAAVRRQIVEAWGIDKSRIHASSYWKRGAVAHHETIED